MAEATEQRIDLTGKRCVLVTAALAEAVATLKPGETIEAYSDDPVAHILVKRWCKDTGNELLSAEKEGNGWRLVIRKGNP
ncbi:sulfurtransferase TusA family protein [Fervidibacter sp.]|jgi:TusA-related sulfurtransferase|nr:sulfurtransferase TusA family protein [Armatimonadota bacterium]MDT7893803.1 sulfurtransferase TusA family protein [Armatimonadota bacterium]